MKSPEARQKQCHEARELANSRRLGRVVQRNEFAGLDPEEAVRRFTDPTPELASYTVGEFFLSRGDQKPPVPGLGPRRLPKILRQVQGRGLHRVTAEVRLRDLEPRERRALAHRVWRPGPAEGSTNG